MTYLSCNVDDDHMDVQLESIMYRGTMVHENWCFEYYAKHLQESTLLNLTLMTKRVNDLHHRILHDPTQPL